MKRSWTLALWGDGDGDDEQIQVGFFQRSAGWSYPLVKVVISGDFQKCSRWKCDVRSSNMGWEQNPSCWFSVVAFLPRKKRDRIFLSSILTSARLQRLDVCSFGWKPNKAHFPLIPGLWNPFECVVCSWNLFECVVCSIWLWSLQVSSEEASHTLIGNDLLYQICHDLSNVFSPWLTYW